MPSDGAADGVFNKLGVVADRRRLGGQLVYEAGPMAFEPPLDGLDDRAAADRADRRKTAEDKRVAGPRHDRPLHAELDDLPGIAAQLARLERIKRGVDLGGAGMELYLGAALQGDLLQGQNLQAADVEFLRREITGQGEHVAPADLLGVAVAQVDGRALAAEHRVAGLPVDFDAFDPAGEILRQQEHFAAQGRRAGDRDACHHGAEALGGKGPIQRHAEDAVGPPGWDGPHEAFQRCEKRIEPFAGDAGQR